MFKSAIEWVVWTIVGLALFALLGVHYFNLIKLPDPLLLLDAYCLGIFSVLYLGAIAQTMKRK